MGCGAAFWLVNILMSVGSASVNYCGARVCENTNAHTLCQYHPGPSPQCVGYINSELTKDEQSRIVARLNRRRNGAAEGHLPYLPTAGNMLKLRWVEELAREAQRWADQCRPPRNPEERDECRDLYSITVGQCVTSVVGDAPGLLVESMVDVWYMQSTRYKGNVTYYVPPVYVSSFYADFAQMIWSRTYMVGCGRSKFMTESNGRLRSVDRLVCNFAPRGPPPATPLWEAAEPAALCPPRAVPDAMFTALCEFQQNTSDRLAISNSMSLEERLLINTVLDIENNETLNYLGSLDEIYLTRLAISTMKTTKTTSSYVSIQTRDVDEQIKVEVNTIINNKTSTDSVSPKLKSTTIKLVTLKKKVGLIGRPKPYGINELDNEFDDNIESKLTKETVILQDRTVIKMSRVFADHGPRKEKLKQEKDFYPEYDFLESTERILNSTEVINAALEGPLVVLTGENRLTTSVFFRDSNKPMKRQDFKVNQEDPITENMMEYVDDNQHENVTSFQSYIRSDNEITLTTETGIIILTIANITENQNESFNIKDEIDEYLMDPETVRELQKELNRIEQSMSGQHPPRKHGKVRRELEETPTFTKFLNTGRHDFAPYKQSDVPIADEIPVPNNMSILDRSPMYNMVMKYMPYIKQYENKLPLTSRAYCISNSIVLVLPTYFNCVGVF